MSVEGKTILVLGLGDTGLSMAHFLTRRKARVRVADTRAAPPRLSELRRWLPQVDVRCGPWLSETFAGIDLVAETVSVMLQVLYFKWSGGKRLFRMAPLHHHYELSGWKESQVVVRFWIITMMLVLFGLSTLKLR